MSVQVEIAILPNTGERRLNAALFED